MRRRDFLSAVLAQSATGVSVANHVLVHEHVIVDFAGAESRATYDRDEVFRIAKPKIEELRAFGCARLQECTPNYLGRDARLLRMLSDATGIDIWTNTGIYGAADRKGIPKFAYTETAEQLAARWIREVRDGVDGVKPRFIKTAVNGFPLQDIDRKLLEAAAETSLETGLTIASHTNGGGAAAMAQLDILDTMRCPASMFVWVHAQNEKDHAWHERAARAGAWVEFDGISEKSAAWHAECVLFLQKQGMLGRALVSQDAGWYHVGEPGGGSYRGYTSIYTEFLPKIPSELWTVLLVKNPRGAFGA